MEQTATVNLISELQAIEIAESVVEGTVVEMVLDVEDNRYIYKLVLKTSNGKTDVEVNARTGNLVT